jgi:hypothetical protein
MIMGKEELERIEELKRNEELLYNCINYLDNLWSIGDATKVEQSFKNIGFTQEDLKRLEIVNYEDF